MLRVEAPGIWKVYEAVSEPLELVRTRWKTVRPVLGHDIDKSGAWVFKGSNISSALDAS